MKDDTQEWKNGTVTEEDIQEGTATWYAVI